ncbi:sensor domain-containing diguanylate cyclase [Bacillus sp. Marseille-P3661]|uniref:sensor domain-containing diguanylate cyclase n=1 Tax=Bacillus sp. Marseille-P3661 TaxID=1936234 RepID=UPI000C860FB9|nr:diguanylate cyclase [Bacillus sp. Marseille-P3661]
MISPKGSLNTEITEIKSYFFGLITDDENTASLPVLTQKLVQYLKNRVNATFVGLYLYNKWKERYYLEQCTEQVEKDNKSFSVDLKRMTRLQQHLIKGSVLNASTLGVCDNSRNAYVILLKKGSSIFGFLYIKFEEGINLSEFAIDVFNLIGVEVTRMLGSWKRSYGSLNKEERYEQLYRVTAKFHSSMDMDDVLEEVIHTLKEVYPSFDCVLLLSHDNSNHHDLPIQDLQYGTDSVNQAASQAFLTGDVQIEDSLFNEKSVLYAPLKGKQGIYGVLQVNAPNTLIFPNQEIGFIELLANTAGSALENAQLYQQSRRLISDLQLINKTSHRLNSNLRLSEIISFMTEQITTSFDAHQIGFVMFINDGSPQILAGSTDYFTSEDSKQLVKNINEKIINEKEALFIGDLASDAMIEEKLYRSLMAVPMMQSGNLIGAVYVVNTEPYHFSFDKFKLLQSLIHHSTLAFTNSMLREELEKMVITDHLTKLHSRGYLDEKIQQSMNTDALGTFLIIDIDNFKCINDTYGHQVGDDVIIQVAEIIKRSIRDDDVGARWGGEELAVYLPRATLVIGTMVAERLVRRVAEETNPKITISCGVATWFKERSDSVKKLFNRADEALYKAKQNGKNRVVVQEDSMG